MKKNWWKYLAVVLMTYVIVAGFKIPLSPGILSSSHMNAEEGKPFQTDIRCYNTFLESAEDLKIYLWLPDDRLLPADNIEVVNDTYVKFAIDSIPGDVVDSASKNVPASLLVDSASEGHYFMRNAVSIKGNSETVSSGQYEGLDQIRTVKKLAFPFQHILYETSRNTYFHVAIWMAMFALLICSCVYSIKYLIRKDIVDDYRASSLTTVSIVFGIAGLLTGSMWAKHTWGAYWTDDIKLNMTAVAMLIYLSYWILRASLSDPDARARLSAVFNVFAFASLMVLVMVIPRLTDSLHPGNGGNPAFSSYDMDNTMRMVFYPAIIGYFLIGLWLSQLHFRYMKLEESLLE